MIKYGIQGGVGSFNEEAARYYFEKNSPSDYEIKYLYTSENVLKAIDDNEIDFGQFAVHNSTGGIVQESLQAMASHKFRIVDQFQIKISHALMIMPDAEIEQVDTFMSHPQVFAQCKSTLVHKYPNLKLVSGEGEMVDHANIARALSRGELDKNIAVMGSKVMAEIYDLKVVAENLQDQKENYTSFLVVKKI